MKKFSQYSALTVSSLLFLIFLFPQWTSKANNSTEDCLGCHSNKELNKKLINGDILYLYISPEDYLTSTHNDQNIECDTCHIDISDYPHPTSEFNSIRDLSLNYYKTCQKCHSANYTKTQDSIHDKLATGGNKNTPICTDCHGAHYIKPITEPRSLISSTCGNCHGTIFKEYELSVHGRAFLEEKNQDVPVCTDCHGVHDIQEPTTPQFRNENPELCASCHADKQLMTKYGLTSEVYDIYNFSWHGIDLSIFKSQWPTIQHESAVCSDCHGIHNIRRASDPQSTVNPNNLNSTCQKCHPNAGKYWTQAWTGHNPISLNKTPFLFYATNFYGIFIPIILWTSIIYVLLQVLRLFVERARSI